MWRNGGKTVIKGSNSIEETASSTQSSNNVEETASSTQSSDFSGYGYNAIEQYAIDNAIGALPGGEIYSAYRACATMVELGNLPEEVAEQRAMSAANMINWGEYWFSGFEGVGPDLYYINDQAPDETQLQRYQGAYGVLYSVDAAYNEYSFEEDVEGKSYDELSPEMKVWIDENYYLLDYGTWMKPALEGVLKALD